ncbi:uncharacterized protein At2g34160-like isoform X2 [Zingiber officinale]|uniref:uncharacterized protein At2g34160-like isoform X2 n=1 Tax=Zingiber officinale TaxID=94328 RepID=UPI001C4DBC4D|nr:uncharacterized protein At2g34160-like isoform X2 [Zingiber officinale]
MATTAAVGDDGTVVAAAGRSKKNRIQVSTNKKPLFFYVNLAKQHDEIELSALGMAIGTVVTVAEILKNNGLATAKMIQTSTVGTKDEVKGRLVRKAKIEILLGKTDNFNDIVATAKIVQEKDENGTKGSTKGIIVSAEKAAQDTSDNGKTNSSNGIVHADKVAQDPAGDGTKEISNGIVSADQVACEAAEDGKKE